MLPRTPKDEAFAVLRFERAVLELAFVLACEEEGRGADVLDFKNRRQRAEPELETARARLVLFDPELSRVLPGIRERAAALLKL